MRRDREQAAEHGGGPTPSELARAREWMVETQLVARGIRDPAVLHAMRTVPREAFVSAAQADIAYSDEPRFA